MEYWSDGVMVESCNHQELGCCELAFQRSSTPALHYSVSVPLFLNGKVGGIQQQVDDGLNPIAHVSGG